MNTFSIEDLLLVAIKSEMEAKDLYVKLSLRVKNFLLRDRFNFLAGEEEKHSIFFENLFKQIFPERKIRIIEKSRIPLPSLKRVTKNTPLSEILEKAMNAEKLAHDFYMSLVKKFSDNPGVQKMLHYIATMEMGHYRLLEIEKENIDKFEDFDIEWPMIHLGP